MSLHHALTKLAHAKPDLRQHLLPLLEKFAKASLKPLVWDVAKTKGVASAKVLRETRADDGDLEVTIGVYFDPQLGALMGRHKLTSMMRRELDRVLSRHRNVELFRLSTPPGTTDPYGLPDVTWEASPQKFKDYYAKNPQKLIVIVKEH